MIVNTLFQQHKRPLYTWTSPDGQYCNQIDYILCSQRWRCSIQSAKTTLGADCGSDHKHFIEKFRLKLKKVGKTTRPFRYDLNQISYNYTVEVAGDMILYIENPKGATKNPQKEMNSEKLQNTKLIHRSLLYFYTRTTIKKKLSE